MRKSGICECRFRSRKHPEGGGGSLLAAAELGRRGAPASEAEAKRVVSAVMRKVGEELGNTAAVARDSYVSPVVLEHYRAGRTIEDFRPRNGPARFG